MCFLNGPLSASVSFTFGLFNHQYNFYSEQMWKIIHVVSSAGIQTNDLSNTSLFP